MAGRNPKGAVLDQSLYEQDDIIACFDTIRPILLAELRSQQRDIDFDSRELSLFLYQLQRFQQDHLGFHDRLANAPLRIPAKLFKLEPDTPLTKDSPIYTILLAAYTFRVTQGWKGWDFTDANQSQKYIELVQTIRDFLLRKNILAMPCIAFAKTLPESARKTLSALARKIDIQVTDDLKQSTHILYGPLHRYDGLEEEWFRTLEKKGNTVLVHWWYYPDSYDSWLPQTEQFADPEEPPDHTGPWHIMARWLQDIARFNEIMNEEDYEEIEEEIDEEMIEATSSDTVAVISGIKRKANEVDAEEAESTPDQPPQKLSFSASSNLNRFGFESSQSSSTPVLILNPGHQPAVRIRDIERDRPQLGSRQRKNEFEPYSNGDMTNISQFIDTNIEYPKHRSETKSLDEAASSSGGAADESQPIDKTDISSLCHASPYHSVIVSLPSWFSLNEIHDIEKMALAEYFTEEQQDKQHSPEQYKKCRNYMIEHYRKNPSYYLSIIACKAELEADLVDIVRIHSFLELHGLINTQVDPRRRIFDPYIDSDCDAAVKPKSQRDFQDRSAADMQRLRDLIFDASIPRDARSAWSLEIDDPLNPDQRKVFKCSHCHVDCSAVRYQNLKHKGFQVCIDCYLQGRFPATMASGDFLRVDSTADTLEEEDWSREEVLRLLEGIDMYDEDWLMISEHVGSRSKEQCVTKFLQLPMDDEFLTAQLNEQEMEQLPFSDVSNPVMTLIAFLSGHINPGVGSAAAKSALKEFLKHGKKLESTDTNEEEGEEINVDADDKMSETSDNNDINDANGTKAATPQSAFDASVMKQASLAALKGAVDQAEKLASYEDQEIQHWTRLAVKTLVDKLTLKVQQYDELDTVLGPELKELEKQSAVLAASFESLVRHRLSNVSSTSSTAAAAAAVAAATPVTSATPSTPVTAENSSAPPTSSSQTS